MPDPVALSSTDSSTDILTLRPGCPVLRRDDDTLQVGLRAPLAVRLPRHRDVVGLLTALQCRSGELPQSAPAIAALRALHSADLLIEGDDRSVPAPARAQFGSDASRRAAERARHRVAIVADGPAESLLGELLEDAGLQRDDVEPTVSLIVASGVLGRSRIDPLQRDGAPHLVLSGTTRGHRLGPFVEPGRTACLRCVDAEDARDDPRLPLLLEQAAAIEESPADPVLERLALTWAVRDLARWAEGDLPSTWSATVDIEPTSAPEVRQRLRHPHCGCAWDLVLQLTEQAP